MFRVLIFGTRKQKLSVDGLVYDTATGRYLLIPQGTHLRQIQQPGRIRQSRVRVVCKRIILPHASLLSL
jgi:type IV secretory pathway VirB10-like protein